MKTRRIKLNAVVHISKFVFWPPFLALFSYLFFIAEVIGGKGPGLTGAEAWVYVFREFAGASDVGMSEFGLAILFLTFGTLILATLAFIAAWVPAAIIGVLTTPVVRAEAREEAVPAPSLGTHRRSVSLISALLVGIIIPLFWGRAPYEPIRQLIWPVEELAFFLSFAALYLLTSLLLALLYRNHQRVVGWEGILFFLYLGLCLAIGIPSSIQKHNWGKQAEAELEWMKKDMNGDMARMEALHSLGPTNDLHNRIIPQDEPSQHWRYRLMDRDGNARLDMDGVTIVFEGVTCSGMSGGGIQISGPGHGFTSTGTGDREFSRFYKNGVAVFTFAGHRFRLMEQGKILTVGEQEFRLNTGKPTLLISKGGTIRMQERDKQESNQEIHRTQ